MQTNLKARLADGRCLEHSRTIFGNDQIAIREKQSHLSKAYGLWLDHCLISPFDVPIHDGFEPGFSVPGINTHIGVIDVSNDDLSSFRVIRKGSKAMGLQGFTHRDLNTLSPNGVHWTLLLNMVWMKKDFRPVYVATELAIDSVPLHYSSLLLPLADNDGAVTRVQIVTRPSLAESGITDEAF